MADYESRKIRGWRGRLDDEAAEIRRRFWTAPAQIVYYEGQEAPSQDQLSGHSRWFNRVFGQERAEASAELRRLKRIKQQIRRAELTDEQREEKRAKDREWFRQWRAKKSQSSEWRAEQAKKKRQRRAAKPELYRAIGRRSEEKNRVAKNERRRLAYKENPEKYRARTRAYRAAHREAVPANAHVAGAKQKAQRTSSPCHE